MSLRVKQVARFLGADLVGITQINPLGVYSYFFDRETINYGQLEIPHKYAIVMAIEMSWPEIFTSPNWGASAATALAYSQMAELALAWPVTSHVGAIRVPLATTRPSSTPVDVVSANSASWLLLLRIARVNAVQGLTTFLLAPDSIDFGIPALLRYCFVCARISARAIQSAIYHP